VASDALKRWTAPLTNQLTLLADDLLQDQGIAPRALQAVILATEAAPWPGLTEALETTLGRQPTVAENAREARLRGLPPV